FSHHDRTNSIRSGCIRYQTIKNRLPGGWPHFVNPTTSANFSITKSEPTGKPAGPHDLEFDDFGNSERWQILI
ncbi:hypothetical protein KHU12_26195, partial [Pseudocitrobacter faecalis]|uniref:hypothetical protein n=1 Tax=Pseudocitrobacter faecalis TaxID=1398493 RepID=UPI003316281A